MRMTKILPLLAWGKLLLNLKFLAHICGFAHSIRAYTQLQVNVRVSPFALSSITHICHALAKEWWTISKTVIFARSMVTSYSLISTPFLWRRVNYEPFTGVGCLFWLGQPASAYMWDIGPYYWSQSWIILAMLSGEELRSRTSPWKVACQLQNSILISWITYKSRRYGKIVSFLVGLLYSILIRMYNV